MGGREAVPQMHFKRVPCDDPGVAVFGISGSLGPRARPYLARLTDECRQRDLQRVVLDLSDVDSLGGGTAQLLNEFAAERHAQALHTCFVVLSPIVRSFLCRDPNSQPRLFTNLEEAVVAIASPVHSRPVHGDSQNWSEADGSGDSLDATGGAGDGLQVDGPGVSLHPSGGAGDLLQVGAPVDSVHAAGSKAELPNADSAERSPHTLRESAVPRFVEDVSWEAPPGSGPARDVPDEEKVRASLLSALQEHKLASNVHVLSLQADGDYHPVTRTGVELEQGIAADGVLAKRVLQSDGPALLFDLCTEPFADNEEDLVARLNCEVVSRFERRGAPEMLVFLSKERPGDEYTLDELARLKTVLEQVAADVPSSSSDALAAPNLAAAPEEFTPGQLLVDESKPLGFDADAEQPVDPEHERTLRRKVAKLREILRLGRGFDAAFGSSRILDVLVLSLVSLTRSDSVLYFTERASSFHLTHHRGLDPPALPDMQLSGESSLAIAALESESAVRIAGSNRVTDEEKIWARQHGFQYIVPFRSNDHVLGLLILGGTQLVGVDPEMLTYLLHEAALAYDRADLYETLEDRTLGVVRGLMTLIEGRTSHDAGATENVVRYAQALAREVQFPHANTRDLLYGTVLRDVGMLRVDQNVLNQTGQLSADEWEDVRRHTIEGAAIMRQMRFNEVAVDVVLHHHEAYNGEGYPVKLRGRAIPLGARIVAVSEAYVKMTMDRPYRKALGRVEALESLAENWGLRYDPLIVDALVRVVNRELSMGLEGDVDFANHLFGA